ncbi:hypothetical protein SLEP1_g36915 [Rubroshorea leprosula]|uniref:Uncharacterized protein n=1 Tax=Rubroshorea leprosula TaxID=152421 RepID=A0AAV5KTG0_9ROSI|nr:hypothetical protein SLEP1_g36915 [Rubroshorea leprosula]
MVGKRGRRPAEKAEEKASKLENTDPASGGMESQPECVNPSAQTKESPTEDINPLKTHAKSRKKAKVAASTTVRRSQRFQSAVMPAVNKDIEQVIDEVTVSDGGKEEDPTNYGGDVAKPSLVQKNLEDRVYFIERQLETLQRTVDELKSKPSKDSHTSENSRAADVNYRSLYFDSQKKIEALTEENHQLALKLEFAHGKVEVYETGASVFSEVLQKLKDVVVMSNLTSTTESAMNVSSRPILDALTSLENTGVETRIAPNRERPGTKKESKRK